MIFSTVKDLLQFHVLSSHLSRKYVKESHQGKFCNRRKIGNNQNVYQQDSIYIIEFCEVIKMKSMYFKKKIPKHTCTFII